MFSGGSKGDGEAVGEGSGGRVDAGGGTAVATEAKTAVSVRFGVGNVKGVGDAAPGRVQAPISPAPSVSVIRVRRFGISASDRARGAYRGRSTLKPARRAATEPRGGAGGSRTHTRLPSEDFKSPASAHSATAPGRYCISGGKCVKRRRTRGDD